MPTPQAQAAIDAITAAATTAITPLGDQLTAANANLDAAAKLHTQDQQTIVALQQQQQVASPLAASIVMVRDLQRHIDWVQPGATGNVGATGNLHGTYKQIVRFDGSALWQVQPKHKVGDPWDTMFWYLNLGPFDDDVRKFNYRITWSTPTPTDYDAIQQLETNWEVSTGSGRLNWGLCFTLAEKVWKWYKFAGADKGWKVLPSLPDVSAILRGGDPVSVEQVLRRVGTNAVFDAAIINGTGYKVGMSNPIALSNWKPYMQYAWQADAKGQDQPFSVITSGMHMDWV